MPTVKTVYQTSEIAHIWAHQKAKYARNPQGNFYFDGPTIFSYGSHFPIARLVQVKGETVVFMTTKTHSSTTAGHVHAAKSAVSHLKTFHMSDVLASRTAFSNYRKALKAKWEEMHVRRACRFYAIQEYDALLKEANSYADLFNLKTRFEPPKDYAEQKKIGARLKSENEARYAERMARRQQVQEEHRRMAALAFEEKLPLWKNGKLPTNMLPRTDRVELRLVRKQKFVETSMGAIVPLEDALKVFRLASRYRRKEVPHNYDINGAIRIGGYPLDSIDPAGNIKVGCHNILWGVMSELAAKLNVKTDYEPGATGTAEESAA